MKISIKKFQISILEWKFRRVLRAEIPPSSEWQKNTDSHTNLNKHTVCHSDEGGISASSSTKIGELNSWIRGGKNQRNSTILSSWGMKDHTRSSTKIGVTVRNSLCDPSSLRMTNKKNPKPQSENWNLEFLILEFLFIPQGWWSSREQ